MTSPEDFTRREVGYLESLIRMELRRQEDKIRTGEKRWGNEYRRENNDEKVALLESMYRKLGKDPADITVMEDS